MDIKATRTPFAFSLGSFAPSTGPSVLLADPSSFEEPLLQSTTSVVLTRDGRVCSFDRNGAPVGGVSTSGGSASDKLHLEDMTMACLKSASSRLATLTKLVDSQLQ